MSLLSPIDLAGTTVRNRLVFGPHETNLCQGRSIGDRHAAYYRRRALGGAGIIVTETASVHHLDWPYERAPLAEACGPGWATVAEQCRGLGAVVVASIGHAGLQGSSAHSQRELWAPSRVPDAVTRELAKEMEATDISEVLDGFERAASIARRAGVDGVEINAGQFSLVRQFLSGLTNQRGDEWGLGEDGSNRLAFARAVIERVRRAGGIVGLRLSCDELAPWAGLTPDSAAEVASELATSVDYLVVVRGSIYSADATRPDSHVPAGFNLELTGRIRSAVAGTTAVVAQGSIVDVGQAQWALDDGRADLVEMTRAMIADPDVAVKAAVDPTRIRPCLLCNQRCRVRDGRNPIVSCVVNPTTGYEATEPDTAALSALSGETVHVVGAGPAGLEAARVAASAGADVHVWEATSETCGVVRTWSEALGREPLGRIVDWLELECVVAGVEFHFDQAIVPDQVADWRSAGTTVLVCTGGRRRKPDYDIDPSARVLEALDVLAGTELPDGPIVIWDPIGGPIGISVAETLAEDPRTAERSITLVTPDQIAGTLLSLTGDLASASSRLLQKGVAIVKHREVRAVSAGSVEVVDPLTGLVDTLPAAVVIDAGHRIPDHSAGPGDAGDAVAPRTIYEAILEGRRVAIGAAGGTLRAGAAT